MTLATMETEQLKKSHFKEVPYSQTQKLPRLSMKGRQ